MEYTNWLNLFFDSWQKLEGIKTVELFSNDVKYYETPNGKMCDSIDEVKALWEIVPKNQKNIKYSFKVIISNEEVCIVNWEMTRTINEIQQFIDGIFEIRLNDNNLCNYFKQWRYTENIGG